MYLKKTKKQYLLGAGCLVFSLFCTTSNASHSSGDLAAGSGFEREKDLSQSTCLNGTTSQVGGSSAELGINTHVTHTELTEDLSVSTDFELKDVFSLTASSDFVRHSTESSHSRTFIFRTKYKTPTTVFNLDNNQILTQVGQNALNLGSDQFRVQCGDSYVSKQLMGGGLYFSVKYHFTKTTDSEKFDADVSGIFDVIQFNSTASSTITSLRTEGTISIRALQVGGVATRLPAALASDGSGTVPLVSCTFDNIGACQDMITNMANYAADDFVTQFPAGGDGGAILGYVFSEYGPGITGNILPLPRLVTTQVTTIRRQLEKDVLDLVEISDIARSKMELSTIYANPQKLAEILNLKTNVDFNIDTLRQAGTSCWHKPLDCVATEQQARSELKSFDSSVLINSRKIKTEIDYLGITEVTVFERISGTEEAVFRDFTIEVPPEYVVVGGGVEGGNGPGHMTTASYPDYGLSEWRVSSKNHIWGQRVRLKGYAIGLKIKGLTADELRDLLYVKGEESNYAQHPSKMVSLPSGYKLIGGGMNSKWDGYGNFAVKSYPYYNTSSGETSWVGQSKDHSYFDAGYLDTYVIGIPTVIPNIGRVYTTFRSATSTKAAHPSSTSYPYSFYALTSCGSRVNNPYNSSVPHSLIWKIRPQLGTRLGCNSASKDHGYSWPTTITTYAIGMVILP